VVISRKRTTPLPDGMVFWGVVCIRVFITSNGKVAIQLAGPASPPARTTPYQGTLANSTSASRASDPDLRGDVGGSIRLLKLRQTASYCELLAAKLSRGEQ
jgi:hypothetical protein